MISIISKASKKDVLIDLILGIVLGVCIFLIPQMLINAIHSNSILDINNVSAELLTINEMGQFFLLMIFSFIFTLVLLILNRRTAIGIAGGTFIILLYGSIISNRNSQYLTVIYQTFRNVSLFYFIIYTPMHLVVHSIAWLIKRKRKIITIVGLISWWLLIQLITYSYAIVTA